MRDDALMSLKDPSNLVGGEDARRSSLFHRLVRRPEAGGVISAILAFAFFAVFAGNSGFLTSLGTAYWLDTASELGIVAIPVGILMIGGEFDLSVGAVVGATSMIVAICSGYYDLPGWVGFAIALVVGAAIGFLNGFIVVRTRLPSFIVTLSTMLMVAGVAIYVMEKTSFGNWVYATGGNVQTARLAGVPTDRVKTILFTLSSLGAVLLGTIETYNFQNGSVTLGAQYVFTGIAACVIGGILLTGGYGSLLGSAFGA